ncbi:MAG: glycosyltransferase family 2 protein, partial [candidate division KSB1 bacterium]|nr:glycosyltransferase family 2 protein [candidate division KSB1 bacterium]
MKFDWAGELKSFPDSQKVQQIVIIPTYKEPLHILERTIGSIAAQTLPLKQINICLATEAKEAEEDRRKKVAALKRRFAGLFNTFYVNVHTLAPGEAVGKASNERAAAIAFRKKYIDTGILDPDYCVITSCDADHKFHPNHFAALTYKFLDNPRRYKFFWQPVVMFYNNIWELPAITRVPNTLMSIWNLSQLPRRDRLINAQNYSLSFKLLHQAGYWDPDKIPEDWGIFFKALFETGGGVEVDALYLPLMADAAQSENLLKTLKSQYEQLKRWAYGVSDVPWIVKNYFLKKSVPFLDKTSRAVYAIWAHLTWPVNWFFITIGLTLPTLLNPSFGRTTLGYMV